MEEIAQKKALFTRNVFYPVFVNGTFDLSYIL